MQAQNTPALLAEIWRLDEIDARRAGVGGFGETRQPTQAFTRFFLRQFVSKSVRYAVALNALKSSGSVFTFVTLVWNDMEKVGQSSGTGDLVFESTEPNRLRQPAIEAIHSAATDGSYLEMPDFSKLLSLWKSLETADAVKEWYSSVQLQGRDLARFLSTFVERSVSRGDGSREVRYAVHRKTLDELFPEFVQFEPELTKLNEEELPNWERFAVDETLKRIGEKKKGAK
jgi:hypothetical protein